MRNYIRLRSYFDQSSSKFSITYKKKHPQQVLTLIFTDTDSIRWLFVSNFLYIFLIFSLSAFGETFKTSFASYTWEPYNAICNSVFGFPKGSNFLYFLLQSAILNTRDVKFWRREITRQFGPYFFTSMLVIFNDSNIHLINQEYLVLKSNKSVMYQVNW